MESFLYMKPCTNTRRYFLELGAALALYILLLFAANAFERALAPQGGFKVMLALLPMVGMVAALWAIMRAAGRLDELQRRIQFEALTFSFAGTALITFAWGFAETAGLPRLSYFCVWPLMAGLWIAGLVVAQVRYR